MIYATCNIYDLKHTSNTYNKYNLQLTCNTYSTYNNFFYKNGSEKNNGNNFIYCLFNVAT